MNVAGGAPRVLFVDQTGQLGGAELFLLDLVRHRGAHDRAVLLDAGPLEDELRNAGAQVHVLPLSEAAGKVRKRDGLLRQAWAAKLLPPVVRRVRELAAGIDVIYANTPKAMVVASLASRGSAARVVYHLHDILSAEHFSFLNRRLLVTLANRYADAVVANSEATAEAFVAAGGKRTLVTVIPNGIDPLPYEQAFQNRLAIRERLHAELGFTNAPVVGVFGRLAPWKGQTLAIRAISAIPNCQ
ncbi:MAG: glycosyltransferase family 4 protein, partial [Lacipirellulaceae bacterium]